MSLVPVLTKKGGLNFMDSQTGSYIHSQYDPLKEVERSLSILHIDEKCLVSIGLGAGYLLEYLSSKEKLQIPPSLYIWEPEEELLDSIDLKKK